MGFGKPAKKEVINISEDDLENGLKTVFSDIDQDMKNVKIEGDKVMNIEGDTIEELGDSVTKAFGTSTNKMGVDWFKESKAVVAIAEQKLFADDEVSEYMKDYDYEGIVRQAVVDMTTDEEQIRIFQVGLGAATDKAKYVEQATNKLASTMKDEIKKRIMERVISQEGNA